MGQEIRAGLRARAGLLVLLGCGWVLLGCGSLLLVCRTAQAQVSLEATPRFPLPKSEMAIRQAVEPDHPFTVTGATGAILGLQNGSVEIWDLPTKMLTGLRLKAEIDGYPVPIDLTEHSAEIEVAPDHTTITYAHAAITVRQHMFVPAGVTNAAKGAQVFFEIAAIKPAMVTISFEPSMVQEWPAPQFGRPSASWVAMGTGGGYVLSTDNPGIFGMVAMPGAVAGVMAPYQERPQGFPLEFRVRFDPAKDGGKYFPMVTEVAGAGEKNSAAAVAAMTGRIVAKAAGLPATYKATSDFYEHFFEERLTVKTPDAMFDKALRWAEIAIEQSKVRTAGETGLVAGWYPSFDSARPGFGWYFGRDTLWSMYAIDSYGDRALGKSALEFLARRQRADGKMMHEFSLTAAGLTGEMQWSNFGYEYAAADATPLFVMAVADYVRTTGDTEFLRAHWDEVKRAYAFERAHDSDGDGVYDNSEGTGWVEQWAAGQPHQELYLAALDESAARAVGEMAGWIEDAELGAKAKGDAEHIAAVVAKYRQADGTYAFSLNKDGSYDKTLSVYPSVAMWSSARGLPEAGPMLAQWSGAHFATDWGVRAVGDTTAVYDAMAYHQGTVWPLFTGWAAMAEYRGGRPMAGYRTLMQNVGLTWTQDPGFVTEVISGAFFEPLGRSSSHQLWSSAMTLAPAVRGMFGVEMDAIRHAMTVAPKLPVTWDGAEMRSVRVGDELYTVTMRRERGRMVVTARGEREAVLCLNLAGGKTCGERAAREHRVELPLPKVEIGMMAQGLPLPGAATEQARVTDESYDAGGARLTIEAMGGSVVELQVRRNGPSARVVIDGAAQTGDVLRVTMPAGEGFVTRKVAIGWAK